MSNYSNMSDKQLLRQIMFITEFNQSELAAELCVNPSVVSLVINEKQALTKPLRKLAEILLAQYEYNHAQQN